MYISIYPSRSFAQFTPNYPIYPHLPQVTSPELLRILKVPISTKQHTFLPLHSFLVSLDIQDIFVTS